MCEGGWRAGLGGRCCAGVMVLGLLLALQVTSPSLEHGGHSQSLMGLENNIFQPLLIGCSQPWTGM